MGVRSKRFLLTGGAALQLALSPNIASAQTSGANVPAPAPRQNSATLPLPMLIDNRNLGTVEAEITQNAVLRVNATGVAERLGDLIMPTSAEQVRALGAGLVPVAALEQAGVQLALDAATLSLVVTLQSSTRQARVVAVTPEERAISGAEPVPVSGVAGGVTAALVASSPLGRNFDPLASIAFAGFLNLGGVRGLNLDFSGDIDLSNQRRNMLQRGRLVLFKDWPDQAIRAAAGDITPNLPRLAGTVDVLGLSVGRDYAQLQPNRNVRPTLTRSFTLERRSAVEVYANGALVERFIADPGPIDVSRIPLSALSNQVSIVVEDALGRREVDTLSFGSDVSLLGQGIEEFSFSAGVLRAPSFGGIRYTDDPIVSLFYQRGISPSLTLAAHGVATRDVQNLGGAFAFATLIGVVSSDVAISHNRTFGTGAAFGLVYRGAPLFGIQSGELATVSFDYRTRNFATLGVAGFANVTEFDLRADYQKPLTPRLSVFANVGLTGLYDVRRNDLSLAGGMRAQIDRFSVNVGGRYLTRSRGGSDVGAFVALSLAIGPRGNLNATYDTSGNSARVEYRQLRGFDLPEVDYRVGASRRDGEQSLFGGFGYGTTRFDLSGDVSSRFRSNGIDASFGTVRLQTGIGFADGVVAVGRDPARGFAIVSRHPSLRDATLTVKAGAAGRELGFANSFGPALVPINSPYRQQVVSIEGNNIPAGYDLGAGRYALSPGARSGVHLEIGTDAYRAALATLSYAGEPISLASGTFESLDNSSVKGMFFTNRTGRAFFQKLAAGRYRLDIPDLLLTGEFLVPDGKEVLIRLGDLELKRR